jgi:hypothetical protein
VGGDSTEEECRMISICHDPHCTFRFAEDRIIPHFHLEGVEAGRRVAVYKLDPDTVVHLGVPVRAAVGEGGWLDLAEPIIVRAGAVLVAVTEHTR